MVFKRLLGSLGVGAPTVDTVLDPAPVLPGGTLTGQVHLDVFLRTSASSRVR